LAVKLLVGSFPVVYWLVGATKLTMTDNSSVGIQLHQSNSYSKRLAPTV